MPAIDPPSALGVLGGMASKSAHVPLATPFKARIAYIKPWHPESSSCRHSEAHVIASGWPGSTSNVCGMVANTMYLTPGWKVNEVLGTSANTHVTPVQDNQGVGCGQQSK